MTTFQGWEVPTGHHDKEQIMTKIKIRDREMPQIPNGNTEFHDPTEGPVRGPPVTSVH